MKAKRIKGISPDAPLSEGAAQIIDVRLSELTKLAPKALKPEAAKKQHDMRIAAKRLRYVLEATGFCFGRPADTARRRAKDLQELLGEIHDVDVMLPRLRDHRRAMRAEDAGAVRRLAEDAEDLDPALAGRAPHRTSYRGLEVYEVYLQARRELLVERFAETWRRQEKKGVWKALEKAVRRELEAAARRREAAEQAARARSALEEAERAEAEAAGRAQAAAAELERAERERRRGS